MLLRLLGTAAPLKIAADVTLRHTSPYFTCQVNPYHYQLEDNIYSMNIN